MKSFREPRSEAPAPAERAVETAPTPRSNAFRQDQLRRAALAGEGGGEWGDALVDALFADEAASGATEGSWITGGALEAEHQPELPLVSALSSIRYAHTPVDLDDAVNAPDDEAGARGRFKRRLWARPRRTEDNPFRRRNKAPKNEQKLVKTTSRTPSTTATSSLRSPRWYTRTRCAFAR